MFKELMTNSSLLDLPVLVMLLFIGVFCGVIAWVYSKKRRGHYQSMSMMPLEDGDEREENLR